MVEAFAQKRKKSEIPNSPVTINVDSLAQQIAINIGDYDKAITFGYRILAKDPSNLNKVFHLAQLYNAANSFEISLRLCTIVANGDTINNQSAMELAALNLVGLKANNKAVDLYKKMAAKFNNPAYLYQAALIQYEAKQLEDCVISINTLLSDSLAQEQKIVMSRKNTIGQTLKEEVNLIAAALNVLGFVSLEKEIFTEAKKYFSNALAIQPNFILAENNLKEVVKKEAEQTKKLEAQSN